MNTTTPLSVPNVEGLAFCGNEYTRKSTQQPQPQPQRDSSATALSAPAERTAPIWPGGRERCPSTSPQWSAPAPCQPCRVLSHTKPKRDPLLPLPLPSIHRIRLCMYHTMYDTCRCHRRCHCLCRAHHLLTALGQPQPSCHHLSNVVGTSNASGPMNLRMPTPHVFNTAAAPCNPVQLYRNAST